MSTPPEQSASQSNVQMAAILDELKKINITLQEHSTAIKSLESSKGIMRPLPSPTPHAETHGHKCKRLFWLGTPFADDDHNATPEANDDPGISLYALSGVRRCNSASRSTA
uniref:Uncharacterized protein n=1 Tax=Oryza nivara TaxID=4536 RepID=A0A0E0HR71_ORYNI